MQKVTYCSPLRQIRQNTRPCRDSWSFCTEKHGKEVKMKIWVCVVALVGLATVLTCGCTSDTAGCISPRSCIGTRTAAHKDVNIFETIYLCHFARHQEDIRHWQERFTYHMNIFKPYVCVTFKDIKKTSYINWRDSHIIWIFLTHKFNIWPLCKTFSNT